MGLDGPSRAFSSRARAEPELSFFRVKPEPSPSSLARYQPYKGGWVFDYGAGVSDGSGRVEFYIFLRPAFHPIGFILGRLRGSKGVDDLKGSRQADFTSSRWAGFISPIMKNIYIFKILTFFLLLKI